MTCVNRQVPAGQLSSFFAGKKDVATSSEDQEYLRIQRNGITLEPLNFPATPSVLWNRTAQGESETLHLTTKRNVRLYINEKTLRLAQRHVSQTKSSFECFLVGSISVDSGEDCVDVTVDRFDPGREVLVNSGSRKVKRKVPTTVVPGDHIVPISFIQGLSGADNAVTHTEDEFYKAFQVLFGRISSQEPVNLSHLVSLKVSCHSHGNDDEIIINVNCGIITMATQIQAIPVAPVPVIPTALARNLSGPLRLSEVQGMPKNGYLTMDHTRKLLLLLESDPKAFSLPLLGIWVSGTYSIHHPFIWACCLRFIFSTAIQQRVFAPPNSFLLLLYSPVKPTPEFWECCIDLGQPEEKLFNFYSCYENLHLEIPPGPSSSDPLCFELFPAPEGMGRSLFERAMETWEMDNKPLRLYQGGISSFQKQVMTSSAQGPGEEEPSPEPRPSPSPHPQNLQFLIPDVPETSLSLSFEEHTPGEFSEQGYVNQQIFPQPNPKKLQTKPHKQSLKRVQHNQENNLVRNQGKRSPGFPKEKQNGKQFRTNGGWQDSPSREPLKQILAPNHADIKVMDQQQVSKRPLPMQGSSGVQKAPLKRGNALGNDVKGRSPKSFISDSNSRSKVNGKQLSAKGPHALHHTDVRNNQQTNGHKFQIMQSSPQSHEGRNDKVISDFSSEQVVPPNQPAGNTRQRHVDQRQFLGHSDGQELHHNSCPLPVNQVQRPVLETVFEGDTPDGTLNKSMNKTELEFQLGETMQAQEALQQAQRVASDVGRDPDKNGNPGLIFDQDGKQNVVFQCMEQQRKEGSVSRRGNLENMEDRINQPIICRQDSHKEMPGCSTVSASNSRMDQACSETTQEFKVTDRHTFDRDHAEKLPENKETADVVTRQATQKCSAEMTRPDPYELLMRQDAQLRQLQEQIKLLLQQQNAQLPTANPLLTPPRTPHNECSHGNSKPTDNSPVSMVTVCTNTGASLLLGTPVKPNGKRSAATSPMKEKDMNNSRSLPSSSKETSQYNQKESECHDITVSPEELANQVIELDDPSQTLASSLHAVDIPSFVESPSGVTSPSSADRAKQGRMETSLSSPVLGESASLLVEKRQNGSEPHALNDEANGRAIEKEESRRLKSNHVSLLERNERQFYDNLLNQVKTILDQQAEDESHSDKESEKSVEKERVTVHEPTRVEVVVATMKELQKIQTSYGETGDMDNAEPSKLPYTSTTRQWPLHKSASLSAIPDHPHINYVSFSVDETLDEVFSETYLKYLTDTQLQELQHMSSHHKKHSRDRAVTFSVLEETRSTSLRKGSVDLSSLSATDYTWNNLSMATRDYLGKYCLGPTQPGDGVESRKETAEKKRTEVSNRSERSHSSVTSQGCTAPPCTPEPTNKDENDSHILDIMRLKKLPKLF